VTYSLGGDGDERGEDDLYEDYYNSEEPPADLSQPVDYTAPPSRRYEGGGGTHDALSGWRDSDGDSSTAPGTTGLAYPFSPTISNTDSSTCASSSRDSKDRISSGFSPQASLDSRKKRGEGQCVSPHLQVLFPQQEDLSLYRHKQQTQQQQTQQQQSQAVRIPPSYLRSESSSSSSTAAGSVRSSLKSSLVSPRESRDSVDARPRALSDSEKVVRFDLNC
jgi:hypothetical protein